MIILKVLLEGIRFAQKRSFQRELEEERNKKDETWTRHLEQERKKKQQFEDKVEELRLKWKTHPLYHAVLNVCIAEVNQLCTTVATEKDPDCTVGFVGNEFCYMKTIAPGFYGVSVDRLHSIIDFEDLGYQALSVPQCCALTLALGDGLREAFKSNPDIRFEAFYYQGGDGLENGVEVGIPRFKSQANLKPIDL